MKKDKICCIYKITNMQNKTYYIGSTTDYIERIKIHFRLLKQQKHHNFKLQEDFNKYGKDSFKSKIVKKVEIKHREIEEQQILNNLNYDKVYNISRKASGGDLISDHPKYEEIKRKSQINLAKARSTQKWKDVIKDRKGIKNPAFGVPHSNDRKKAVSIAVKERMANMTPVEKKAFAENISKKQQMYWSSDKGLLLKAEKSINMKGNKNHFYGKKHSKKTINKIKLKLTGKPNLKCSKKIIINGQVFNSHSEAAKILKICQGTISYRIKSTNPKFKEWKSFGTEKESKPIKKRGLQYVANGVIYESINAAARVLNKSLASLIFRARSKDPKWSEFKIIDDPNDKKS